MIQVIGISKSFKKKQRPVLIDISFEAAPGEMVALIGKNGSGKSTLLQIMSGMSYPDSGSLRYFGHEMGRRRRLYAKYCGYLPQANGLLEELSVQDNISLWTGKKGHPSDMLVEMFQLEEMLKRPVRQLSGGMKRRVAVACAMANMPPILLMDEPTAALDKEYSGKIHGFMRDYLAANGIIVAATHDDREIAMANRCVELGEAVPVQ